MTDADNFQRRASTEGRQVQDIAQKVLRGCGFTELRVNQVLSELGVTINFIASDEAGRDWHFDVSGAFTSARAGLIRTDTMWKTLGRANVLHQSGIERLILLTTNLPKADSAGQRALTAAAETYFDAVEMLTAEGRARLTVYAQGQVQRPLPGLRPLENVYSELAIETTPRGVQRSVPVPAVAAALPKRATYDATIMDFRLKVFVPSRDSAGRIIPARARRAAAERIRRLLSDFAGGVTAVDGLGSWIDPIGGEMLEKVSLVEAYAGESFPEALVGEVVAVLFDDLDQHTAALIVNESMVHLTRG